MYYHVRIHFGETFVYDINLSKDEIKENYITPMFSKQISKLFFEEDKEEYLYNFAAATSLIIYKTEEKLNKEEEKKLSGSEEKVGECCLSEILDEIHFENSGNINSLLSLMMKPPKKQIFVLMALGDKELESTYNLAIKSLEKKVGYEIKRIDDYQDSENINNQIINNIAESEIIISDLTKERPNCYYETGFAHALGKNLILTIKKGEPIHFDLSTYRFIQWETALDLKKELEKRIKTIIKMSKIKKSKKEVKS
jgi:hypothetical protein